jgi:hypothetical protein
MELITRNLQLATRNFRSKDMRWRIKNMVRFHKYPRLTHRIWKQKGDRFGNLEMEGRVIKFFDILGKINRSYN